MQLLVDRVSAIRPDFALTDDNAPLIAETCVQLDGLPLAIELAAARMCLFTLEVLTERLAGRFKALRRGPRDAPARRHADYFLALAEKAGLHLRGGPRQLHWLHRLEVDHDNLRSALSWALGGADVELGLRLAVALTWYWLRRGHYSEWQQWFHQALQHLEQAPPAVRASLRLMQGTLAYAVQDRAFDTTPLREDEELFRELGDKEGTAHALIYRGINSLGRPQDYEEALSASEEALSLLRELGDKVGVAQALNGIGELARVAGDHERAKKAYEEALAIAAKIGDRLREHFMYINLGFMAQHEGRYEEAAGLMRESLVVAIDTGVRSMFPVPVATLAGHWLPWVTQVMR